MWIIFALAFQGASVKRALIEKMGTLIEKYYLRAISPVFIS
jgi:hypothetical protein